MRILLPISLIVLAGGRFVVYTSPAYSEVKLLREEQSAYDEALNKSKELKAVRDLLLARRSSFSADNLQKLSRTLPDNVDNIRLILDINNIAARHALTLRDVTVGMISDGSRERSALAVGSSGEPVGSVALTFSLLSSYEQFISFLRDVEGSLRLIDVEKLSFKTGDSDRYDFTLTIRTYWLH